MIIVSGLTLLGTTVAQAATVGELRCEGRDDPLGIDVARAAAELDDSLPAARRTSIGLPGSGGHRAPRPSPATKAISGTAARWLSARSYGVAYAGKPLTSRTRCFWKVRVWDRDGQASAWSSPARWSMGLLSRSDWKAAWIGYDAAYQPSPQAGQGRFRSEHPGPAVGPFPQRQGQAGRLRVLAPQANRDPFRPKGPPGGRGLVCPQSLFGLGQPDASGPQRVVGEDGPDRCRPGKFIAGPNVVALTVENTDFLPAAVIGQVVVQFESGDDLKCPIDNDVAGLPEAAGRLGQGPASTTTNGLRPSRCRARPGARPP